MSEVTISKRPSATPAPNRPGDIWRPDFSFGRSSNWSPFTMMRELSDEIDRMFRGAGPRSQMQSWAPAIDVQCCNGSMVVSAELPGLKKEDVRVEITGDALVIEGERTQEHKEDHDGYHRSERNYGFFRRSVPLPEGAKTNEVKAELKEGLLTVSVPVPEVPKNSRQVPIA